MKTLIIAGCLCLPLAFAATAAAETLYVGDPTPTKSFSGDYTYEETYECDANGDGVIDPGETCTRTVTGSQEGYVRASTDGGPELQACNANPEISDATGQDLTGYAYVSPSGSGPTTPTYGNENIGADDYEQPEDTRDQGDPCPGS